MELSETLHTALMFVNNARNKHNQKKFGWTLFCLAELRDHLIENLPEVVEPPGPEVPAEPAAVPVTEEVKPKPKKVTRGKR